MGAPAYATRARLDQLRASNVLQSATDLRIEDGHAVFEIERPGVALLKF